MSDFLTWIKSLIEELAPALAVMFWNFEQTKVIQANNEKLKAETSLQIEKNHESVDAKYANSSDIDIVNDAILEGSGGNGQPKPSNEDNRQASSTGTKTPGTDQGESGS